MEEAGGCEEERSTIFLPLEQVVIVEKGDKDDDSLPLSDILYTTRVHDFWVPGI